MLTRRGFAGFASCAICGITEFIATEASAQGAPVAVTPGLTRKILAQMDGPMPGYVTVNAEVEIEPGVFVARHTHPGIESGYLLEGGIDPRHTGPTNSQFEARRWLPGARRNASCWRQERRQKDEARNHVCRGERQAPCISSLRICEVGSLGCFKERSALAGNRQVMRR